MRRLGGTWTVTISHLFLAACDAGGDGEHRGVTWINTVAVT